ncbi:MAG: branched-chain amino acid ABC transporter permease [Candidatus Hodarchaeota archaeon]
MQKPKMVIILIILLIIVIPIFLKSRYLFLGMYGLLGGILTLAFDFSYGYCGLFNFSIYGFLIFGGYCTALLIEKLGFPFFGTLPVSLVLTIVLAYILGKIILRLRHWLFGLASLCFSMAIYTCVSSVFSDFTYGADGIRLPDLLVFEHKVGELSYFYFLSLLAGICFYTSYRVRFSKIGRAMRAIRSNETVSVSVGINIPRYLNLGFLMSAVFSGLSGALWVQANNWATPEYFTLGINIKIFTAAIIGGVGNPMGAFIGGFLLFLLSQALIAFEQYHVLFYGIILVVFLRFFPLGILNIFQRR